MDDLACKNTDRELWRGPDEGNGSYYADSVHVTEGGAIGMNVGGYVIVMRPREWHAACKEAADLRNKLDAAEIALENERERCAKIVEGQSFREHYREWPWFGTGNRSNDSDLVIFCDAAVTQIRRCG